MKIIPRQTPHLPPGAVKLFIKLMIENKLLAGECIEEFEGKLAEYVGTKHAILISSGRAALYIILKYFNVKEGDEIILPSFTCPVVPSTIVSVGANPVFVDVEPETFNINPLLIERYLTKNTKAIIATHIEGQPCDLERIIEIAGKYNLKVIEDSAQSLGAEYKGRKAGNLGDVAYFSFAMGKQINTRGGGAILTNDDRMAEYIRNRIKNYPQAKMGVIIRKFIFMHIVHFSTKPFLFNSLIFPVLYLSNLFGRDIINVLFEDKGLLKNFTDKYCVRYSNLQAAIGLRHLEYLEGDNKKRVKNADTLNKYLHPEIHRQKQIDGVKSIYLYYSVLLENRERIKSRLLNYGVDTQEGWNISCSSLNLFREYAADCPVADALGKSSLYIPIYPHLNEKDLKYIAERINEEIIR